MGMISLTIGSAGEDGIMPRRCQMTTTDNLSAIEAAGYLNPRAILPNIIDPTDIFDVIYDYNVSSGTGTYDQFIVSISSGIITLSLDVSAGNVVLPVVDNDFAVFHGTTGLISDAGYLPSDATKTKVVMAGSAVVIGRMAHFVDTSGTVDDTAAAVTNAGDIYAGLDAVAGAFRTYSSTTATGYFGFTGVANSGAYAVILSNAAHGQASTYSIPDCAASTANILVSKLTGTQHITVGSLGVDAGALISGLSTGGQVGTLQLFATTTTTGSLRMLAAANAAAYNVDITNASHGQSTVYTMADIGAATGGIPVATSAIKVKSVAGASAAGGNAAQSFTDAFCTTGSNVIGNWNTQTNAASVLKIVPGNGSFVVTSSADAGSGTFNYIITK